MDYSFPRSARLLEPSQFSGVFKKPIKSIDSSFIVLSKSQHDGRARLGLAIAKKRLKRAVDRNLVKRLVRESFRHHQIQLKGLDFVVMVQSGIDLKDTTSLSNSLSRHWSKIIKRLEE